MHKRNKMFLTHGWRNLFRKKKDTITLNFFPGRLIYSSHKEADVGKLNYDLFFRQISTIDIRGDTSFVANFEIIKYILLDKDLYYHDYQKGYFEILTNPDDTTRLVAQRKLKVIKREVLSDIDKSGITLPLRHAKQPEHDQRRVS